MHRYTATLDNEPDNPWRWTGDANNVYHAATQAALNCPARAPLHKRTVAYLTLAYQATPDTWLASVTVVKNFASKWVVTDSICLTEPVLSVRGG